MRIRGIVSNYAALLSLGWCVSCSTVQPRVAGDVVDTPNEVAGYAVDSTGAPVEGALVRLRDRWYVTMIPGEIVPADSLRRDTVTDAAGRYSFRGIREGAYALEIVSGKGTAALRLHTVNDSAAASVAVCDTLRTVGTIRGAIAPEHRAQRRWYVQILGLERLVVVDSLNGGYAFTDLPRGIHTLRRSSPHAAGTLQSDATVTLHEGGTVTMPYAFWRYRRGLRVNSPQLAALAVRREGWPALVVRLDAASFDFSQAAGNGADVRFVNSLDQPVPFEIEFWDGATGRAAVWVSLDSLSQANGSTVLGMQWGNPQASASGFQGAVFDTSRGYRGVWHLHDDGAILSDATVHGRHGIDHETSAGAGLIGNCRLFTNGRIDLGSWTATDGLCDSMSVSAWIRSSQVPDSTVSVLRSHRHFTALQFDAARAWSSVWNSGDTVYNPVTYDWGGTVFNDSWRYFVAQFKSGVGTRIFLDGELLAVDTVHTAPLQVATDAFWLGGTESGNELFSGAIDEVRIERAVRSDEWIRFNYLSQRAGSDVVTFE